MMSLSPAGEGKVLLLSLYTTVRKKKILNTETQNIKTIQNMLNQVERELRHKFCLNESTKILCAVSGGVDSIVMLDVLYELSKKMSLKLFVCHYNHNLRGKESDADEKFVKNCAKQLKLPFYSTSGEVQEYAKANKLSIEHSARNLRYKYFEQISNSLGCSHVCTAHNADDSVETFFLNLFRGTGLTGLKGIPPLRRIAKKIIVFRPLLSFPKEELKEYARAKNLSWREDRTNDNPMFTRNKIRTGLIPYIEKNFQQNILGTINRAISLINSADSYIAQSISDLIKDATIKAAKDRVEIRLNALRTNSTFIQGEMVQKILADNFDLHSCTMNSIERILDLCDSQVGSIYDISSNYSVLRDRNSIIFYKKSQLEEYDLIIGKTGTYTFGNYELKLEKVRKSEISFTPDAFVEYFDADLIPNYMQIKSWQQGDRFTPLGSENEMKLSDFLINMKIPLIDKQNTILLKSKDEIIWVCGLRISNKFKVTESSRNFLRAEFKII